MREADALGRVAVLAEQQRYAIQLDGGVEHRDTDIGSPTGASASDQRLEDRFVGVQARADVDERYADPRRCLGSPGNRCQARFRLDQQVVGLAVA